MNSPPNKYFWYLTATACTLFYIFTIAGSINKPFATDEIYYAGWASGIAHNGVPAYYSGEGISLKPRLIEPLSHPPLHFMLLAGMVLVFGLEYWSLRLLGVILFVGVMLLLRLKIFKQDSQPNERLTLTAMLLVFNPLFMQQSMVLAIEAQAFWFFLLLFLYLFHLDSTVDNRPRFFPYLRSSFVLVCLFWLKETNIPVYIVVCVTYLLSIGRLKRIPFFALSLILSAGVFWLTWLAYCSVSGVDVYSWWNFTVKSKMLNGNSGLQHIIADKGLAVAVQSVISSLRVSLSWISAPYFVLFLLTVYLRIREIIKEKRPVGFVELCLLYTLVLFAITKVARPTTDFIKYEVPAHLLMAVFMADVLLSRLRKDPVGIAIVIVLGLLIGAGLHPFFEDRILEVKRQFPLHLILGFIFVLLFGVAYRYARKAAPLQSAIIGLTAGIVILNTHLSVHQSLNVYTTGQSWGNYGQDLRTPTQWLKAHLKNGETFAAFKDLQFNLRFVEGFDKSKTYESRLFTKWISTKTKQKKSILKSGTIKYIVLNRYSKTPGADTFFKKNNYRKIETIGDHIIYERITCPACNKRRSKKNAT